MTRVAIMGSGSWGTAFGMVLADAGSDVVIWGRDSDVTVDINDNHRNDAYHPGIDLPARITATTNAQEATEGATLVVLAVPAQVLRANLGTWGGSIDPDAVLVSLMKGIELGTTKRMSQVIIEAAGVEAGRVAVVSGPNLAREIAQRQPAATTVACADESSAHRLQDACTNDYFRPYWTTDVVGTEIGGPVKNVIALANGMAVGMG
ncbi:MAG: NAD(P)-binding domain-containing protein, partial [Actinobacteria bacterium]|nr:NAD(P)-binding domain-containing protein [Actinomycetota bacterium]